MSDDYTYLKSKDAYSLRQMIRSGAYSRHTAGLGAGCLQVNLAIMPAAYALDFMRFCQRNPKPCPLAGVTDTGSAILHTMGRDIDVRTDVPAYNIYRQGELIGACQDISDLWTDDMVAFALGCSFTFEHALQKHGIAMRHIDQNLTVPMFRSNIDTVPAGPFRGPMVVSMRPIPRDRIDDVVKICRLFPLAHGAPIHVGAPSEIGIPDLAAPDWGDAVSVEAGEVPVFWACGVTPQVALEKAGIPLCITHKPGHMLVTDVSEEAEVPVLAKTHNDKNDQHGERP